MPQAEPLDDLTRIRGIDKALASRLAAHSVMTFEQIANWTAADVRRVSATLGLGRSISKGNWIEQAALYKGQFQRPETTTPAESAPAAVSQISEASLSVLPPAPATGAAPEPVPAPAPQVAEPAAATPEPSVAEDIAPTPPIVLTFRDVRSIERKQLGVPERPPLFDNLPPPIPSWWTPSIDTERQVAAPVIFAPAPRSIDPAPQMRPPEPAPSTPPEPATPATSGENSEIEEWKSRFDKLRIERRAAAPAVHVPEPEVKIVARTLPPQQREQPASAHDAPGSTQRPSLSARLLGARKTRATGLTPLTPARGPIEEASVEIVRSSQGRTPGGASGKTRTDSDN